MAEFWPGPNERGATLGRPVGQGERLGVEALADQAIPGLCWPQDVL
jgi:hypothetical protein